MRPLADAGGDVVADHTTRDIAVIMVTALRSEGYIVTGLRQADDYVCKPFSIGELVARLNAVTLDELRAVWSHYPIKSLVVAHLTPANQ